MVPNTCKRGKVVPLYKGKNHTECVNNYRPLTILSNVSKLIERVVPRNLYTYCERHNILTSRNSGYKPDDPTVNQ